MKFSRFLFHFQLKSEILISFFKKKTNYGIIWNLMTCLESVFCLPG